MKQVLVVDNEPKNYVNCLENGIPIIPYLLGPHAQSDTELLQLKAYLATVLQHKKSMSRLNHEYFGLKKMMLLNRNHLLLKPKENK